MASPSCVVFDLDDTLFLERDYVRSGIDSVGAYVAEELQVEGFAAHAWSAFEAGVRGTIFNVALERCGMAPTTELVGRLVGHYRAHRPAIELLEDARKCITRLQGHALAVVTDGPLASQRAKAEALGIERWARLVVFTAELGDGFAKPHCRAFELIEEATGCRGAHCTYMADNPAKDFAGPRSLGWVTVRVRRPGGLHRGVPSGPDVDVEVDDLSTFPAEPAGA